MEFSKPERKGRKDYGQVFNMGKTMIATMIKDRRNPDNGNNGELQRRQLSGVHSLARGDSWQ